MGTSVINYHVEEWCTEVQHMQEVAMLLAQCCNICDINTLYALHEVAVFMAQIMQPYNIHAHSTALFTARTCDSMVHSLQYVKQQYLRHKTCDSTQHATYVWSNSTQDTNQQCPWLTTIHGIYMLCKTSICIAQT